MANEGLVKIGALWRREKDGKVYLTGKMGEANLLIYPNQFKKSPEDKSPDYQVFVSTPLKQNPDRPQYQKKDPKGHNEPYPF